MIQSMTGYANAIIEIPVKEHEKLSLSIQIKSLNSRYFEVTSKIPYLLMDLDVAIQKLLKQKLHRGHAYITIKIQHDELKHSIIPALTTIKGYIEAINAIKQECQIKEDISLQTILGLPNIFQTAEESLGKTTETILLEKLETIIDQLIVMRTEEGTSLANDITNQITIIAHKLNLIKEASAQTSIEKKQELDSVIQKLQAYAAEDICANKCLLESQKATLLSELEKIDIHEEIVRAQSHLISITQWLKIQEPSKGKKLDFILQELNREINTIASKCSHFTISSLAIDIKSELEKCREQAQNIV